MARVAVLLLSLAVALPLQAQTRPPSQAETRRTFIESGVIAETFDSPTALGSIGVSGEFGLSVWHYVLANDRTATFSVRARVEVLNRDGALVSFTVAPKLPLTGRVALETPFGFAFSTGSWGGGRGVSAQLALPIAVTDRIAVVPRGSVHILLEDASMPEGRATLGLAVRCRF